MSRSTQATQSQLPAGPDQKAFRHFGDGTAGEVIAARLQAYNSTSLAYEDVALDNATGGIVTASSGGGGGAVTAADGAIVGIGAVADVAWVSGNGTLIAVSKAEFAKLEAVRALLAGTLTVNVGLTDTQLRASAVPVSLTSVPSHAVTAVDTTFGATVTPKAASVWDVADRSARLVGHVTVDNASLAVTGTFFQATQPVSLATNTPDVTDRAARLLGHVTVDSAPTTAITAATLPLPTGAATSASQSTVKAASTVAAATDTSQVVQQSPMRADAANLCVTNTAATGVACTLTIPSAGAGLFHYISLIEIQLYATAARTGGATPVLVTTTNLPGNPVWDFDTAQAIGVTIRQTTQPATPIKCTAAATATTIVAPIATTGIWRITAYYYAAP